MKFLIITESFVYRIEILQTVQPDLLKKNSKVLNLYAMYRSLDCLD